MCWAQPVQKKVSSSPVLYTRQVKAQLHHYNQFLEIHFKSDHEKLKQLQEACWDNDRSENHDL